MIHNVPPYMKKPLCAYVDRIMNKKKAPVTPTFASPAVKELLGKCLKMNPEHRSSAAELIEYLRGVYTPLGKYDFAIFTSLTRNKSNMFTSCTLPWVNMIMLYSIIWRNKN